MKYLFIGMLLNSIVTSEHADREACEGRKTLLAEKGVVGQCIKQESSISGSVNTYSYQPNALCRYDANGNIVC